MKLTWLHRADKLTDAGTLFGPFQKLCGLDTNPTNNINRMSELTDPILIQYKGKNYLDGCKF